VSNILDNRYEFVFFFDVENGNPNGDPDAGNMPRIDPQTGFGIVTDVCLKRKVRNYVEVCKGGAHGYDIYVTEGSVLNNYHKLAYDALKIPAKEDNKESKSAAQRYMCERFFDIRAFGAVMDTGDYKCGQVRGPVQLCFARSLDVILQQEVTITRMASTKEEDAASKNRTMGRKYIVPYALYRTEGFVSANFAKKTGFTEEDLGLFFAALKNMFEHDRSAARGKMVARKLFVFKHDSPLGCAPSDGLFARITAKRTDESKVARAYTDYRIEVNEQSLPDGVTLIKEF
jgi:CRISPR-associated protein Csd2